MSRRNEPQPEIILVYLSFKGVGQVIRLLLSYLDLPFTDIYLDEYETQKPTLSQKAQQAFQAHQFKQADLPAIIHEGQVIYELNQIMTYICRAFDREDLLGTSLQQKTQVCQIMEIYSQRLIPSILFLTNYVNQAFASPLEGVQLLSFIERKYLQLLNESGYILELTVYLLKQEEQKFIFENITIVDFYYLEGARHTISLFGAIDEESTSPRWTDIARKYRQFKESIGQKIEKVEVLRAIKKYSQFFRNQQFYQKRLEYLDSFRVFPKQVPETILMGLKKLWAIDEKHLHY